MFGRSDEVVTDLINNKPLAFLTNLFEGIDIVRVNPGSRKIHTLVAKNGEEVPLVENVATAGISPEMWLKNLEAVMVASLRHEIFFTYLEMDDD